MHKFWFLVTLTFLLLVMYEKFSRKKYFKWRVEAVVPGKLKSRLSVLPYSEEEYNMQFKSAFPSQKQRVQRFSLKTSTSDSLLNYCDGLRKTSFVPLNKSNPKIYIFGGSTIDCQEVPDDYTITSRLQAKINGGGLQEIYEVINCGVIGATLAANLKHFKELRIAKGDICIFYFGANESTFTRNIYISKFQSFSFINFNRLYSFATNINFVVLKSFIDKFRTFDKKNKLFCEKQDEIDKICYEIDSICDETSVTLFIILQPFLHKRSPVPQFDHKNRRYHTGVVFEATVHLFEQFAAKLNNKNYFVDGRSIFNNVELDVFTDWCHCNYLGNDILAEHFYSLIQKRLENASQNN